MLTGVHAEPPQLSPVSCKNEKTNEYSTYLWIQKTIKVNIIHILANCMFLNFIDAIHVVKSAILEVHRNQVTQLAR